MSDDFHAKRATCIGGSDWEDVFGLEWGCRRRFHYAKSKTPPDVPFDQQEESFHIRRGKLFEDDIAREFESQSGMYVKKGERVQHPKYPFLGGNVDYTVFDPNQPDLGIGILELKCPGEEKWLEYRRDGHPVNYELQCQHYMHCMGLKWGVVACFNTENMAFADQSFTKSLADEALWHEMIRLGSAHWGLIRSGEYARRLDPTDIRCQKCPWRQTCQGDAVKLPTKDESVAEFVVDYKDAKAREEKAKDDIRIARRQLETHMAGRREVECSAGKVRLVSRNNSSISARAVRELYPDVANALERNTVTQYLKVD